MSLCPRTSDPNSRCWIDYLGLVRTAMKIEWNYNEVRKTFRLSFSRTAVEGVE